MTKNDIKQDMVEIATNNMVDENGELEIYGVKFTPSVITIVGYEELQETIKGYANKYRGLVFEEKDLKMAKDIRSELNGVYKSMDDKRKEIKREFTKPLTEFENDMKIINNQIKEVIQPIDNGIKEIEQKQRDEKRKEIEIKISEQLKEKTEFVKNHFEYNPKWENKTFNMKKVAEEVDGQISILEKEETDLNAKINIVKAYCSAVNVQEDGWLNLIDSGRSATEIISMIDNSLKLEKEREASRIRQIEEDNQKELEKQKELETKRQNVVSDIDINNNGVEIDVSKIDVDSEIKKHTIKLEITGSLNQLKELKSFMDNVGITTKTIGGNE